MSRARLLQGSNRLLLGSQRSVPEAQLHDVFIAHVLLNSKMTSHKSNLVINNLMNSWDIVCGEHVFVQVVQLKICTLALNVPQKFLYFYMESFLVSLKVRDFHENI